MLEKYVVQRSSRQSKAANICLTYDLFHVSTASQLSGKLIPNCLTVQPEDPLDNYNLSTRAHGTDPRVSTKCSMKRLPRLLPSGLSTSTYAMLSLKPQSKGQRHARP